MVSIVNQLRWVLLTAQVAGDSPPAPLRSWAETAAAAAAAAGSEDAAAHARRAADKLAQRLRDELFAPYPTPVQRQAVPCLLEGRDLFAVAPTGEAMCGYSQSRRLIITLRSPRNYQYPVVFAVNYTHPY